MPDLTIPLISAAAFIGVAWLIVHAGQDDADAIGHTLKVFALALGLLVTAGLTAKLRASLGIGRMTHRVEARSKIEPAGPARPAFTTFGPCHSCRSRGLPPPPARKKTRA